MLLCNSYILTTAIGHGIIWLINELSKWEVSTMYDVIDQLQTIWDRDFISFCITGQDGHAWYLVAHYPNNDFDDQPAKVTKDKHQLFWLSDNKWQFDCRID